MREVGLGRDVVHALVVVLVAAQVEVDAVLDEELLEPVLAQHAVAHGGGASIAVSVDVDLDARHEMLLDEKLGDSDGWKTSHPLKFHHHHLLLHHPLCLHQLRQPA